MASPAPSTRLFGWALLAAGLGALACLWVAWCEYPVYGWNEVRLAPAFAVRHGINPYPPLGGGPLSTWIYGPIGILINLPATWASSVTGALQAAWGVNAVIGIAPLAVIFFGSRELRARGVAAAGLALALGVLFVHRWHFVMQVADRCAIAFGLVSCWWLARPGKPGGASLAAAAALATAAIWAKQIETFLALAQLWFLFVTAGRRLAGQYSAWLLLFNGLALGLFAWAFGFANLWLNLVAIPARLPWADFSERLAMQPLPMLAQLVAPAIALVWWGRKKGWPATDTESGRFFRIAAMAFATMLPVGLVGYFKVGGGTNLLHSWDYLLPALLLLWLAPVQATRSMLLRVLGITAVALLLRWEDITAVRSKPYTQDFAGARQLTALYPQSIWFPQDPLITFFTDGKLWHNEDGLYTRYLAGYGVRESDFRRHLPPNLRAVAYPSMVQFPFALQLLPEFNQRIAHGYWTIYIASPPSSAR